MTEKPGRLQIQWVANNKSSYPPHHHHHYYSCNCYHPRSVSLEVEPELRIPVRVGYWELFSWACWGAAEAGQKRGRSKAAITGRAPASARSRGQHSQSRELGFVTAAQQSLSAWYDTWHQAACVSGCRGSESFGAGL